MLELEAVLGTFVTLVSGVAQEAAAGGLTRILEHWWRDRPADIAVQKTGEAFPQYPALTDTLWAWASDRAVLEWLVNFASGQCDVDRTASALSQRLRGFGFAALEDDARARDVLAVFFQQYRAALIAAENNTHSVGLLLTRLSSIEETNCAILESQQTLIETTSASIDPERDLVRRSAAYGPHMKLIEESDALELLDDARRECNKTHTSLVLVYCDIDGLLGINRVHGTGIATAVVSRVALCLASFFAPSAVYRMRGDQFFVLRDGVDGSRARAMADARECQATLQALVFTDLAPELFVTATFSVAMPNNIYVEKSEVWLVRAIVGARRAKQSGASGVGEAPQNLPPYISKSLKYHWS